MKNLLNILKIKSKDKKERLEGISILSLITGTGILMIGIGLSILNTKGISAILAMLGSLITFASTMVLIFTWLIREWSSE